MSDYNDVNVQINGQWCIIKSYFNITKGVKSEWLVFFFLLAYKGWVNDDWMFSFGATIPLKSKIFMICSVYRNTQTNRLCKSLVNWHGWKDTVMFMFVLCTHILMRLAGGGSHYEASVLCQASLCHQHQREDPTWRSHTFLYTTHHLYCHPWKYEGYEKKKSFCLPIWSFAQNTINKLPSSLKCIGKDRHTSFHRLIHNAFSFFFFQLFCYFLIISINFCGKSQLFSVLPIVIKVWVAYVSHIYGIPW